MTATTNGASLEDCLTNIFSLIDLNGIRWKRFKHKENSNYLYTPIDTHPILTTYAKCIEENHIAVWRHETQKRHSTTGPGGHSSGGNTGSAGHSNFPTPTRASNNNTPTGVGPNNLSNSGNLSNSNNNNSNNNNSSTSSNNHSQNNYELWIFGYANQLKVDNVIGEDLIEVEDDTWESKGLSYECRTLLFKALHNLIERCLITKGFTRIGRWFVQPSSESNHSSTTATSSHNLSSTANRPSKQLKTEQSSIIPPNARTASLSSTISLTLSRIIESRRDDLELQRCLDKSDGLRHTSDRSYNSYFTSSLDGSKLSRSFTFSFFVHGDSTVCTTVDVRQHPLIHPLTRNDLNTLQDGGIVRVALAPFGLNGILNGVNYKDSDNGAATTAFIQQWSRFYPLPKTLARLVPAKSQTHSAMTNFNPKTPTNPNQFNNQTSDNQGSRSYLSNLTNMLIPPTSKPNLYCNHEPNEVPPVVEVIVAGYRMRYPSECVFTTSRIVDIYKSLDVTSNHKLSSAPNIKRANKSSASRPNKLSLLSEKLAEDRLDNQAKVNVETDQVIQAKPQSNFNSPFRLGSKDVQQTTKPDYSSINHSNNNFMQQAAGAEITRDKNTINSIDQDGSNNSNSSSTQTIPRFNSTKIGLGSNNPLGPNDLVKLFPTPPSLEQIVPSPSTLADEAATKEQTILSPANFSQIIFDSRRDNGIDVYKPVECALMPPPPKWAPLTSIAISSTKLLPPQCIYKKSSSNSKTAISKLIEPIKSSSKLSLVSRQFNSPLNKNLQQSVLSPLTDQTNKNGFNSSNLSISSPKPIISHGLLGGSTPTANSSNILPSPFSSTSHNSPILSSSFTLPHQRLFNNLNEINSIQLNLVISDTVLGMFQDHNFENCTLCVCNMTIRGTQTDPLHSRPEPSGGQWRPSIGNDNIINSPIPHGEYANECTCGFSAITNRHCSHLSGLFLEDELELTNVLYDPTEMIDQNKLFRKIRLSNYTNASYNEEQKLMAKMCGDGKGTGDSSKIKQEKPSIKEDKSSHSNRNTYEETKMFVIDQLKQQCSTTIHSNSSLTKVLLVESFRNNRHLTSCSNYYAQTSTRGNTGSSLYRFFEDNNKYTTVKMMNRNPLSLRFSDFCELTKSLITKLGAQSTNSSCLTSGIVKPLGTSSSAGGLSSIFLRMFNSGRKSIDLHSSNRSNIFAQGLQALVMPTLSIDPKGALQMLEELVKDDSKEALATLNKAILIFSSPIHDWQFITAPIPENNLDVANLLKILQPYIEESVGSHNKKYKDFVHQQQQHIFSARDSPTGAPVVPTPPCQGPLTWRQFHQTAGRGTEDQCEPQPIPSLLVGHHVEKNQLALSPFALKFWDKLSLEPYAPGHNMFYTVIAPENQIITEHVKAFFKELSNTYELMKLGKHSPIGDGIVLANNSLENLNTEDGWYADLGFGEKDFSSEVVDRLKSYAAKMNASLAKTIVEFMDERQPPYDPHADRFDSSPRPHEGKSINPLTNNAVNQQNAPSRNLNHLSGIPGGPHDSYGLPIDNHAASSEIVKSQAYAGSYTHGAPEDNIVLEDDANKQSGIVIYIIDPFSSPSVSQNLRALSTIGLFRCYSKLIEHLPENLRMVTQLQIISMDSIICNSRPTFNISRVDQLKSMSMNIYSQCRKIMTNQITAKSLTGFGPAAALENFFKTKNPDYSVAKVYTPPFILAPTKDKQTELGEMFGDRREKSSVLFCSYCITEDQRWLLVSVTNERGEISETTVINTNVNDRLKHPKISVRGVALKKMMEFIVSIMSDWTNPWRLIIGKLGRVGHGELKEWASLLSKRSLLHYSRILTERCRQCTILPATETVSILSACLVSLEPDSKLRIMPDQFTIDDRQASFNKCPLSTPEDASATHILVFPTSASIHAAQGNAEDPALTSGLDDDILQSSLLEDEDLCIEGGFNDLFGDVWQDNPTNVSDNINSHHDTMVSSNNLQMGPGAVGDSTGNQDEPLQLLQQPLALGYYMSTAKIGQMPNWFWSTNPHLRNSCPVFLKSALHFHMPCVQLQDDYMHSERPRKSHQLDSNLTTDVLRYVLEGYNSLSWLALNPKTYDRQSCLPVHMQNLLQLYHLMESFS